MLKQGNRLRLRVPSVPSRPQMQAAATSLHLQVARRQEEIKATTT